MGGKKLGHGEEGRTEPFRFETERESCDFSSHRELLSTAMADGKCSSIGYEKRSYKTLLAFCS